MTVTFTGTAQPDGSVMYGLLVTVSSDVGSGVGQYWYVTVFDNSTGDLYTAGEQLRSDPTDVLLGWSFTGHNFTGLHIPRFTAQMGRGFVDLVAELFTAGGISLDSGNLSSLKWQPAGNSAVLTEQLLSSGSTAAILAAVETTFPST